MLSVAGSLRSIRRSRGSIGSCFAPLYPSHLYTIHSLARRLYSPGKASSKTTQQGQVQVKTSSETVPVEPPNGKGPVLEVRYPSLSCSALVRIHTQVVPAWRNDSLFMLFRFGS